MVPSCDIRKYIDSGFKLFEERSQRLSFALETFIVRIEKNEDFRELARASGKDLDQRFHIRFPAIFRLRLIGRCDLFRDGIELINQLLNKATDDVVCLLTSLILVIKVKVNNSNPRAKPAVRKSKKPINNERALELSDIGEG